MRLDVPVALIMNSGLSWRRYSSNRKACFALWASGGAEVALQTLADCTIALLVV
jgi:hypothetical protein